MPKKYKTFHPYRNGLYQQVFFAPVTAFQARGREKSALTRKIPGLLALATVQSPRCSKQPLPRAIDQ